jgi:hypothetical protein
MPSFPIGPLDPSHGLDGFDCGDAALNRFLQLHAWLNQRANASRTDVAVNDRQVVGYYTLVVGEVAPERAPERIRKGLARHPGSGRACQRCSSLWILCPFRLHRLIDRSAASVCLAQGSTGHGWLNVGPVCDPSIRSGVLPGSLNLLLRHVEVLQQQPPLCA